APRPHPGQRDQPAGRRPGGPRRLLVDVDPLTGPRRPPHTERTTRMRLARILAILGLMAALSLPAAATAAETKQHIGLHDMTCTSITAMGKGLPKSTSMQPTLTNRDTGGTLAGQTVRTSAKGEFMAKLPARLN